MTPVELSRTVLHAVRCAVDAGELRVTVPARVVVAPPGPGGWGDYATNVALQLARPAGQPALRVAEVIRPYLAAASGVTGVEITGPGFLNIRLTASAAEGLVRRILGEGLAYGHGDGLAGQVVSLRIPYDARAEVVADAIVRIVSSQGGRAEVAHGEPVTLRPVPAPEDPAPLGPDAARWALLHPAPHDRPRISADHLVQRESNPLFRVRYAHARTRALGRNAADLGFTSEPGPLGDLDHIEDHADDHIDDRADGRAGGHVDPLLASLADHPRVLAAAATHRAPDRLARHLVTVADAVLPILPAVLPRGEEKPSAAHRARLALAEAAGTVLAGGLSLLGIDAPEHL
ncbi:MULTISPECIES: ArgS-related anticodon-binding protein NrtL [unclassified Streptomyces]|uniref:ArgS-related anticodon-binding protein NrtL n=1 Tax=unclassified Streptomyces TaxID=2593676 RepID=UPI000938FD38|nr:DALR anticodon-binding domain-containing protein [Streptomyces sp. TSRI0107]OKJ85290.1 arginyl-tRNA synthetase [Streptomyces sp. TSRI0107]